MGSSEDGGLGGARLPDDGFVGTGLLDRGRVALGIGGGGGGGGM